MKILFIVCDYLPVGSAESNIVCKMSKELIKLGVEVNVLATKSSVSHKYFEVIDGVKIFRVFYGRNISIKDKRLLFREKVDLFFYKIFRILKKNFLKKNFLNKHFINTIKKGFKKYDLYGYDFYIPVSGFFETYQATHEVLKKHNKNIILYQLDPIINNSGYSIKTLKSREKFELNLSKTCKRIIATKYLIEQKKELNINTDNCICLEFPNVSKTNNEHVYNINNNRIAFFAGTLNYEIRDPSFVLKFFSKLDCDIQLIIAGNGCDDLIKYYCDLYPKKFKHVGILDSNEIKQYYSKADFLVNIGNNNVKFVPSKIFEYISLGKPIINFYKSTKCLTLKYLSNYFDNAISIDESDIDNPIQIEKITKFIENYNGKLIPYEEIKKHYYEFTAEYIAAKLFAELNNIIEKK